MLAWRTEDTSRSYWKKQKLIFTSLGGDIVGACSLYPKPLYRQQEENITLILSQKNSTDVHEAGKGFDSLSISNSVTQDIGWDTSRDAREDQDICNEQTWCLQGFLLLLGKDGEWHIWIFLRLLCKDLLQTRACAVPIFWLPTVWVQSCTFLVPQTLGTS